MDTPNINRSEKRGDYIENWYQQEKAAERIGAISLLFVAALIAVLDKPGDEYTLYTLVACLTGGITLLARSRRPRAARTALNFLREKPQASRAVTAGVGAVILITQFGTRPLAMLIAGVLLVVAGWYQWRAYKIKQFDQTFKPEAELDSEGDKPA